MPYAIAGGIGTHAAFICLKPRQLITLSGLTVDTYIAFAVRTCPADHAGVRPVTST
jgi:hypothetical protein